MTTPPHAPYDVEVGHEVEIRVFEREEGVLVAECEVAGDAFGAETEIGDGDLQDAVAVDELVTGVARMVWHELLGTPVFRPEDEQWVERVAAQRPWEGETRSPTLGYAAMPRLPEPEQGPEPEDSVARSLGDADVTDLKLTQAEMASLMRGEIPEALISRVLEARSTENLIETAHLSVLRMLEDQDESSVAFETLHRVATELGEVQRRFRPE